MTLLLHISVLNYCYIHRYDTGRVAQSVTCPATDASLTADPGVTSSIQALGILSWRLIMK